MQKRRGRPRRYTEKAAERAYELYIVENRRAEEVANAMGVCVNTMRKAVAEHQARLAGEAA